MKTLINKIIIINIIIALIIFFVGHLIQAHLYIFYCRI